MKCLRCAEEMPNGPRIEVLGQMMVNDDPVSNVYNKFCFCNRECFFNWSAETEKALARAAEIKAAMPSRKRWFFF